MADQQGQEASKAAALFPDPPPFWEDFTAENVARYAALKQDFIGQQAGEPNTDNSEEKDATKSHDSETALRIPNVPPELVNLQPPAEPADGKWRLFGQEQTLHDELQSLEAAGIQRLGSPTIIDKDGKHADRALKLKRLSKSLLLNFLEWMGTLENSPQQATNKVQDLKTLLLNFHHILNEYRPHQAREQLIAMMQDQLDAKRNETQAIRAVVDKAKRMLEGLGSLDVPELPKVAKKETNGAVNGTAVFEDDHWRRESDCWESMDSELV